MIGVVGGLVMGVGIGELGEMKYDVFFDCVVFCLVVVCVWNEVDDDIFSIW